MSQPRFRARRSIAVALPAALLVSLTAGMPSTATAEPAESGSAQASAVSAGSTIVGIGDSYMSGEGVMYANHNFPGKESSSSSNWQTGPGALGNEVVRIAGNDLLPLDGPTGRTWRSVFGDANGWPDVTQGAPMGIEEVPFCDRSYAAAPMLGEGWTTKNFACSGATSNSKVNEGKTAGLFLTKSFFYAKPGVDFDTIEVTKTPRAQTQQAGQAKLLQEYATDNRNIKVVALSIGGNDFGFGDLGFDCVVAGTLGGRCETDPKVQAKVEDGLPKARAAVTRSIRNVTQAMANAGYQQDDWKLVYQNPPLPVSTGDDTKWTWGTLGGDRGNFGGCGLADSTLDWVVQDVYAPLVLAMREGIVDAREALGKTPVVQVDNAQTFDGHRLCQKGTVGATNYPTNQAGKNPPWQDNNGKNTEWVTYISKLESASGNIYQKSMPLHPNYWGQRALAACLSQAAGLDNGSLTISCRQDPAERLDAEGRPEMTTTQTAALWISATGAPVVSGIPNVGQTLTANTADTFKPAQLPFVFKYQWLADGNPIAGATDKDYAVTSADLGKDISVRVSAGVPAVQLDFVDATSAPVEISDLIVTVKPVITGDARVGATLAVSPGDIAPTPDSRSYEWYADGTKIDGATGTTYQLTPAELGKRISVRLTARRAGYLDLSLFTGETDKVAAAQLAVVGAPTIGGEAEVGQQLTAGIGSVTFTPSAERLNYRWYRDGQFVTGATEATYDVTGDDVGTNISVSVVGATDGYGSAESDRSATTASVTKGTIKRLKNPALRYLSRVDAQSVIRNKRIRFPRQVEINLIDVFSEWPNDPKITWFRQSGGAQATAMTKIKGADQSIYRPTTKDVGRRIMARIQTREDGWTQATASTAWYRVVKGERRTAKPAKIVGNAKVGVRLTAIKPRWVPQAATARYQWLRDGRRIPGATGRTYVARTSDVGTRLRVRAVAKPTVGFRAAESTSAPTKRVRQVRGLG